MRVAAVVRALAVFKSLRIRRRRASWHCRNILPMSRDPRQAARHMAILGKRNSLPIVRQAPPGFYLDGGTHGEILLPGRYLAHGGKPGEMVDVFVYRDSEDRLVATTEMPLAMVGDFAMLRVISQSPSIGKLEAVDGFNVIDNGIGFTCTHRDSFDTLLTSTLLKYFRQVKRPKPLPPSLTFCSV